MARKNLIEISAPNPERMDAVAPRDNRPIAGFVPQERSAAPVGGITKTLGNITEKMERASELERQLAAGQTIVELDPGLIDASFVSDRLAIDAAELAQLVEQIREHGQQVPILVRPHPETRGRYQVAYGHRRLAAAREIGIRVRAVVRDLTDGQLVVSQGQENSARTNLSYIERALFASRLEERSFGRDVIMAALGVDKAALSRMLIVIRQVPLRSSTPSAPRPISAAADGWNWASGLRKPTSRRSSWSCPRTTRAKFRATSGFSGHSFWQRRRRLRRSQRWPKPRLMGCLS